jgi:hypothetical protein
MELSSSRPSIPVVSATMLALDAEANIRQRQAHVDAVVQREVREENSCL